ncbi:MAG TPA: thiamine pyrophosphate-binding protein [Candidatus Desulfobacillus sp.]|nr:thiamine pyrophosphate-binding protein [Candidatus Desulfobacillus sp.]
MKKTAAWLAVHALEQLGVRFTFGIPGVQNTELYDELDRSESITPVLVTHEGGAAFIADAVSRVGGTVGTLVVVPAAGLTHAASGIAEALLAGVPMLVITGGIRTDLGKRYQLHEIDQHAFMKPLTKATFRVRSHAEVVPAIFEAWRIATSGTPGPAFVELPVNLQLMPGEVGDLSAFAPPPPPRLPAPADIERAATLLLAARRPGLFVGWGAVDALAQLVDIAEFLQAPVATTLQGQSAFPHNHPLHAGFSFGPHAVPAARNAFAGCDALLAVGTRFGELATGSFGTPVPANLVHIDINPEVFDRNCPAAVALAGDAAAVLGELALVLHERGAPRPASEGPQEQIHRDKQAWRAEWLAHDSGGRVNPARFFDELRRQMPDDAIATVDDGNHTFLAAELFPVHAPRALILPTDFNCMGYAVPAAIGAKLAQPRREVFSIVGDGAFMMTCMEILTAAREELGIVYYVFNDGALSQIAQAQKIPYNRTPCSRLGPLSLEGVALATGADWLRMEDDAAIAATVSEARRRAAAGRPVIVDVNIDYSKRTAFTAGVVKTNFKRFPLAQRLRMASRALLRRIAG